MMLTTMMMVVMMIVTTMKLMKMVLIMVLTIFSSVQSLSRVQLFATPWTAAGFLVHHQLPELTQTHSHRVSDAIQPSHPLLSPSLPTFNLSQNQGLFQ